MEKRFVGVLRLPKSSSEETGGRKSMHQQKLECNFLLLGPIDYPLIPHPTTVEMQGS